MAGANPRDLYLATQVYQDGGHTALIGDFVRALGSENAHVILTDPLANPLPLPDAILSRLGVPTHRVSVLTGATRGARLSELLGKLLLLRADRLFLFHHPTDPLASAVSQPEIARPRVMIHHADATMSFGIHLPDVTLVDLSPQALAPTALGGRESALLRLTAPDPGPRPRGFRIRGGITTASSGGMHKFAGNYVLRYPETVAQILRTTEGSHVHIGRLSDELIDTIGRMLSRYEVPGDRFIHVPWTASLALTLWEHDCDLFVASFPVDGARTKVEVLASGTPYIRHMRFPVKPWAHPIADAEGLIGWRTWEDLRSTLHRLGSAGELEASARASRELYETVYHPDVFARRLAGILDGSVGPAEVDPSELTWALARLARLARPSRPHESS